LRRTIYLNDLEESYNSLLGFGMTIVIDVLKYKGYLPSSKHTLAMLIILFRHLLFLIIYFRYFHNSLSGPGVDKLLYLAIELMNFFSKNRT